ncbi:hypothetical protein N0V90_009696 [Kalmusia sp. IMI 367209]|nr:hypothetical protein N0V90_009696 [Kalmusia sp. IMI 367209]
MDTEDDHKGPPTKRRKLELDFAADAGCTPPPATADQEPSSTSLGRPISPPPTRRRQSRSRTPPPSTPRVQADAHVTKQSLVPTLSTEDEPPAPMLADEEHEKETRYVKSPIQLTKIRDLAPHQNADAVALGDILGDPMIKECWNFNYLFDLGFLMPHFDVDVRDMIKVKIVHGFWKREDERRVKLIEVADRYPNVELISAFMPDPFGTHHSKMLILFRHDDLAQVVIHTANMIPRDWNNMTQAAWISPLLPLQSTASTSPAGENINGAHPIGSGERFKTDLLRYLGAYDNRLKGLTEQLVRYDFSAIRAAFLGSAPSRQKPSAAKSTIQTSFGWLGLKEILSSIQIKDISHTTPPSIVIQISSIATLGTNSTWLKHLQSVLRSSASKDQAPKVRNFFAKASSSQDNATKKPSPTFNIIFPTAPEIRSSLDGYGSGGSIHTKIQSTAQQRQLEYLRPLFCHWTHESPGASTVQRREAHRGPAAPHIKTYIRFSDADMRTIDWAMVTSANLSKQAWGELENKKEEVWIQSWETGVVVWPGLYGESKDTVIVPVFGRDLPQSEDVSGIVGEGMGEVETRNVVGKTVVGFRMPYDTPLSPYTPSEVPWCATLADDEPDWMGRTWQGY